MYISLIGFALGNEKLATTEFLAVQNLAKPISPGIL